MTWSPVRYLFWISRWGLSLLAMTVLSIIGLSMLNLWTYQRLTSETAVGRISFVQRGNQRFAAHMETSDGRASEFLLRGDEWQLDVRMIKWASWLSLLGRDPLFRVERLSGRFNAISDARMQARTAYSLSENPGLDLWMLARRHRNWLPGVDAVYGSSVFLPMEDGVTYQVTLGQTGLIARPLSGDMKPLLEHWK